MLGSFDPIYRQFRNRKSRAVVAYRTSQYESAFRGHTMLSVSEPATEKRWRSKLNHLTYPGHICMELLLYTLAAASSSTRRPVGTSIVHETSDAEHPYAHTHFAWWWSEAPNLHGTALFDVVVDGVRIHPHAVHKKSWRWMQLAGCLHALSFWIQDGCCWQARVRGARRRTVASLPCVDGASRWAAPSGARRRRPMADVPGEGGSVECGRRTVAVRAVAALFLRLSQVNYT